jgi:hypothetical protein
MTDAEHLAALNLTAEDLARITEAAYRKVLDNLETGMEPRKAVAAVMAETMAKWNADFLGIVGRALSERLARSVGPAELKAYPVGGLALSKRLYHNAKEVSAIVNNLITQARQGWHSARELALDIYEGYGFKAKEPLEVKAPLPKYLRAAFGDDAAFQALWEHDYTGKTLRALAEDVQVGPALARLYARIKANNLKTPYLKAGYLQALDDLEAGKGMMRLAGQLKFAFYERNRYFANRIAQTEIHRAQSTARAAELMAEANLHWVQVKLSQTHKIVDVCDLHARLNQYGLGPGIYPKAKCPQPPFHPHCLPGDALIAASGPIKAVSKRWFEGWLAVIKTASGKHLEATINHPILTPFGWMSAGRLCVGGHIVSRIGCNASISIGNLFDPVDRGSEQIKQSAYMFHGDGLDGGDLQIAEYCGKNDLRDIPPHTLIDEVVKIGRTRLMGYVYNLETEQGHYTANGIVTHNCRCLLRPRIDLDPTARAKFRPDAERKFLENLPHHEARQIAGSEEKLQQVKDGDSLEELLNAGKDSMYHLIRIGDPPIESLNGRSTAR